MGEGLQQLSDKLRAALPDAFLAAHIAQGELTLEVNRTDILTVLGHLRDAP